MWVQYFSNRTELTHCTIFYSKIYEQSQNIKKLNWHILPMYRTWSSPRYSLRSHSMVHSENNSFFIGIRPIHDLYLTCIFIPFLLLCTLHRREVSVLQYFLKYTSVFKCCYHDIELCFVPYFGAESRIIYILKVYIYSPCINTQQQAIETFNDTPAISPPNRKN